MNILYLINYLGGGGTESYIHSLICGLKNDNNIFLVYNEKADDYEKFKELGITMIQMPMNGFYDLNAAKKLSSICKENSIEVVHSHFLRENSISVLSKLFGNKSRIINTRHMLLVNSKLITYVNKLITRFDKYVIAVSKSVENLLIAELGPKENIKLIYTGIDINNWDKSNYDFREKYKIAYDEILITSTARFSPEKGHEFLIKTIPMILKMSDNKNLKFVFIGDGPILQDMKNLANKLKISRYILFLGYQKDIKSILNASDIYVLCSETEAFGISILEAMASNLPVIATDSGGVSEIIPPNSDYGVLINYGDTTSLRDSLVSLIDDSMFRTQLGNNGFNLVKEKFNLDKTITETFKLYNE